MILVDSSVWIEYFRGSSISVKKNVDELIDNNRLCTNDIILLELIPPLIVKKQHPVVELLTIIHKLQMNINWDEIVNFQILNIKKGIYNVGIPDLMIVQNIIQNNAVLYTLDKHFYLMRKHLTFDLYT